VALRVCFNQYSFFSILFLSMKSLEASGKFLSVSQCLEKNRNQQRYKLRKNLAFEDEAL